MNYLHLIRYFYEPVISRAGSSLLLHPAGYMPVLDAELLLAWSLALTHNTPWLKVWEGALGILLKLSEAFLGGNVRVFPCSSKENRSQKKQNICVLPLSQPIVVQGYRSQDS